MKILEVYKTSQFITNAPIYKLLSIGFSKIMMPQHLAENDLVYCQLNDGKYQIIKNKFGPIGIFTKEQFEEFCVFNHEICDMKNEIEVVETSIDFWALEI